VSATPQAGALPYVERRRPQPTFLAVAALFVIGPALWVVEDARNAPWAILAGVIGVAFVLYLGYGRFGGEGRHLLVDANGLQVGDGSLPAARVGEVEVVPEALASIYAAQGRARDTPIPFGRSTYAAMGGSGGAVLITERTGTSGWLVATRHPERLAAALEAARDAAR
jgi:hypothetical protein